MSIIFTTFPGGKKQFKIKKTVWWNSKLGRPGVREKGKENMDRIVVKTQQKVTQFGRYIFVADAPQCAHIMQCNLLLYTHITWTATILLPPPKDLDINGKPDNETATRQRLILGAWKRRFSIQPANVLHETQHDWLSLPLVLRKKHWTKPRT